MTIDLLQTDQPATTAEDRAPLRAAVLAHQAHSGARPLTDTELAAELRHIDVRLQIATANCSHSNRARGTVRQLRLQRQQLIDGTEQDRLAAYDRQQRADAARVRLLAGAPAALRDAIDAARATLDQVRTNGSLISNSAPLQQRIHRDWQVRTAEQAVRDAVQAAVDWDPPRLG